MPLSNDAQMWADKSYAKSAREVERGYQEKLAQFAGGLIRREDVEARKGMYGYIDERILANKSKAEKKAQILREAYERDHVSLSPTVIGDGKPGTDGTFPNFGGKTGERPVRPQINPQINRP